MRCSSPRPAKDAARIPGLDSGVEEDSDWELGGHKVQGKKSGFEAGGRERLLEDAHAVEQAGACAVVVEGVPRDLAKEITAKLSIPTIGIGAGPDCDGQVLVLHDVVGLSELSLKFTNLRPSRYTGPFQ